MSRLAKPKLNTDPINFFICGLLILTLIMKLMESLSFLPTQYVTYALYGVLWLCLGLHVLNNFNSVVYITLIVGSITLFLCTMESMVFSANDKYIWGFDVMSLITFLPHNLFTAMMFTIPGLLVRDYDDFVDTLHSFARIGVAIGALAYASYMFFGKELYYDDMNFAYTMCIMVCTLIATSEKRDSWFIAVGFFCLFIAGTRGPLICTIAAMVLNVILNYRGRKTFVFIFLGILAIVLVQTNILATLLNLLASLLSSIGITNLRIIDFYNEGNLADTSGRNDLQYIITDAISQRPLRGYGVGYDRMVLDGSYVHNIILETVVSFGILFGGIFLASIAVVIIRNLFSRNRSLKIIAFIFFTSIILKMFFSTSILNCREFSMFLGLCIGGILKERKDRKSERMIRADFRK